MVYDDPVSCDLLGVQQSRSSSKDSYSRGVYSHDQRYHTGHSQSSGCWKLMSPRGHHRYRQPEQKSHRWNAALLQGDANSYSLAHSSHLEVLVLFTLLIFFCSLPAASGLPPRGKPGGAGSCPALWNGVCQRLPGSPGACACGKLVPLIGQSTAAAVREILSLLHTHKHLRISGGVVRDMCGIPEVSFDIELLVISIAFSLCLIASYILQRIPTWLNIQDCTKD